MVNNPRHPVGMLSEAETAGLVDRINATPNLQPFTLEETIHRARYLHGEPGPMDASDQAYAERIATAVRGWIEAQITVSGESVDPIPMVLHCPACGAQHIDQATEDWPNPPHRSHLCGSCGCIWRPADVATVGVERVATTSVCDNWPGTDDELPNERIWRGQRYVRDRADAFIMRDEGDLLAGGLVERQAVLNVLAHHPGCCDIVRRVPYAQG